jgi:hypothetical protein
MKRTRLPIGPPVREISVGAGATDDALQLITIAAIAMTRAMEVLSRGRRVIDAGLTRERRVNDLNIWTGKRVLHYSACAPASATA